MFQSDHTAFPYPNATNLTYVHCDIDTMTMILVPTGNTHQLLTWDVAMCPAVGTLLSSGIDGRLVASATGRFLGNMRHSYFANRNVMALKRRRILKESQTMEEYLKEVKMEGSAEGSTSTSTTKISDDKINEPLEESITEHTEVCQKMWLDVQFDEIFEPTRPEFSCRDQRIESLNCVDGTTSRDWPVSFTGGEAGLLFAVSVKLHIEEMDL
ncbi:TFIIIC_sub6 domain-containing protein [Caenorhabditis elegans]|nr:TFIIIC_sub6 domain-containing protein [Caenorhabditis elegans]CBZ01825.1 TFIIIC_sub6 domain-containing protein [Caenorhabditis elegans]|eukprot:NP_001252372.1 Uncharacterized protein CELE_Y105E8A.21 [Caenorhabditis elegans]